MSTPEIGGPSDRRHGFLGVLLPGQAAGCPLRYDWLEWPEDKCKDRLFMICPVCKQQGCHVGEKENAR